MCDTAISDYALIGDMRSCVLVDKAGSVDWLCLPRHDSPAVFLRLLDPQGGCCRLEIDGLITASRRYLENSNILETTFRAATGTLIVRDFMPVQAVEVPGDAAALEGPDTVAPGMLVRQLSCSGGEIVVRVVVRPTFDYARRAAVVERGSATAVTFLAACDDAMALHIASSHAVAIEDKEAIVCLALRRGGRGHLVLSGTDLPTDGVPAAATDAMFDHTLVYWQAWAGRCTYCGPHRDAVLRSVLCLKLLTYAPTGAIVAAATAGLPETVGGPRNWDYRFTWMRDASFTVGAFLNLGYRHEAAEFLRFLRTADRSRGKDLRILYPIEGEHAAAEEPLPHLQGWRGSRPVLIGNGAADQEQNDIYGEFLSALRLYLDAVGDDVPPAVADHLPDLVRNLAETVEARWMQEDRGIWELRSKPDHFFHSKGMCWLALDCAAHLAPRLGFAEADGRRWLALRDRIKTEVHERCWDGERRAWIAAYGLRELDAAVLRCTLFAANDPRDPRLSDTIAAIERELTVGPHVYRYRMDDGLDGDEGTFVACSFWLAGNWALQGRTLDASRRMAALVGCGNDVGLLGEEIDPRTGEALGNFPQGFSHMALINGLIRLEEAVACFGLV